MRDDHAHQQILDVFRDCFWLTRLHAHVGSQGCPLELIAEGIAAVHRLALDINEELGRRQVTSLTSVAVFRSTLPTIRSGPPLATTSPSSRLWCRRCLAVSSP